ncbi:hypothetical protein AAEX28_04945 [Lentisphaerota bacterium WC36G]|nr:hypothetical protein LJT99_07800 [Lentisphaerae bacterium WC36]
MFNFLKSISSKNKNVKWSEIENLFEGNLIATSNKKQTNKVNNPWIQNSLNGLLNVTPSLPSAVNSNKYLKVIGPPEAFDGKLIHQIDRDGNILGGLTNKKDKKIVRQKRFDSANDLKSPAIAATIFQIASVATSQYYLHNISNSLSNINNKMADICQNIENKKYSKIKTANEIIEEIYYGNMKIIERTGSIIWQPRDNMEFWTRMSHAETSLRENLYVLESEIKQQFNGMIQQIVDKDGNRIKESYRNHTVLLKKLKEFHNSNTPYFYIMAIKGLMQWYQLTLAFDSHKINDFSLFSNGRYDQMVKFVKERTIFLNKLKENYEIIFSRPNGKSFIDNLIDFSFALPGHFIPGGFATTSLTVKAASDYRSKSFNKNKEQITKNIDFENSFLNSVINNFNQMSNSFKTKSNFYILHDTSNNKLSLEIEVD